MVELNLVVQFDGENGNGKERRLLFVSMQSNYWTRNDMYFLFEIKKSFKLKLREGKEKKNKQQ
jgi:hypothetical protein